MKIKILNKTNKTISAIDAVFCGMSDKGLNETTIKSFPNVKNIILPKDTVQTTNVTVKLLQKDNKNYIVLGCDNDRLTKIIFTGTCREKVVETLRANNILPTVEEFLAVRLLVDETPSVTSSDCKREIHHHLEMVK